MSFGSFFASIDPGPAIGGALASVDKAVSKNIPGGWVTLGGLAAGGAALAFAPEVIAAATAEGVAPEVASAELGLPAVDASTGAFINPATGLSWEATGSGLAGNGATLTPAEFASASGVSETTASDILKNANRAKQLANLLTGGSTAKPTSQQFAQFQTYNQPVQTSLTQQVKTQSPYLTTNQEPTQIMSQTTQPIDFLSSLGKANSIQPTLADLLRNA